MVIQKTAETQFPIQDAIAKRWSPRAFSEKMVEPEKIRTILEAGRWAASSYNEQPWNFMIATKENQAEYDRLLSCLASGNQQWAHNAPVLMISVAKLNFDYNGAVNRHAFHDVGAAVASMAIEAAALGLFIHQMAGFDVPKTQELYNIPQGYEPVAGIALGYLGEPEILPEKYREQELAARTRKPLEDFVFTGSWNQTSVLANS